MKILVTGSEGNIGRRFVPYLRSKGHEVCCCDIKFQLNWMMSISINIREDIRYLFDECKPEVVYHLAAIVGRNTCEKAIDLMQVNIAGTDNVIQACKEYNSKLIYFSTSEVYGNQGGLLTEDMRNLKPNNRYGLSKYLGEKLVEYEVDHGLQAIIVRPFLFYDENETLGDHCSMIKLFANRFANGQKVIVFKDAVRSWMHMDDAVNVLEKLCYVNEFRIFNIAHSTFASPVYVAKFMCEELGLNSDDFIEEVDLPEGVALVKLPSLKNQDEIFNPEISLLTGIKRMLK